MQRKMLWQVGVMLVLFLIVADSRLANKIELHPVILWNKVPVAGILRSVRRNTKHLESDRASCRDNAFIVD
jgi:hypothetical protein